MKIDVIISKIDNFENMEIFSVKLLILERESIK